MTDSPKPKKDAPKAVIVTASKAADFKNRKRTGITLAEYKELSAKDRASLTPREKKQLEEAQQHLKMMAETLASKYDFSAITQSIQSTYKISPAFQTLQTIDTSPILKIATDMQKFSVGMQSAMDKAYGIQATLVPALEAIHKSTLFTQNQFTALAAVQKSLVTFPTENIIATIKSIQEAFQAPFIARTLFADIHTRHERVVRDLRFDIGSLTASIEFSRSETVNVILNDVSTDKDDLTATATATQTSSVGNVTFSDSANLLMAFNDLKQEVRELRQQLLAKDNQQGNLLIAPTAVHFQRTSSSIQIGPFKVAVTVSSKQTQFARVLLSTPENITKRWDIEDVIFEAFGERIANDEQDWISKIRSYIHQLNNKVLRDTNNTMPNFFILEGIEVYVNPDYINL